MSLSWKRKTKKNVKNSIQVHTKSPRSLQNNKTNNNNKQTEKKKVLWQQQQQRQHQILLFLSYARTFLTHIFLSSKHTIFFFSY